MWKYSFHSKFLKLSVETEDCVVFQLFFNSNSSVKPIFYEEENS